MKKDRIKYILWEIEDFLDDCKGPAIAGLIGGMAGTLIIRLLL